MSDKHIIIDTFTEFWQIITDENFKTKFFNTKEKAEEYARRNLQEYLVIEL